MSVLPAGLPKSLVPGTISPEEDAKAVLKISIVLALILTTVLPHVASHSMEPRIAPSAGKEKLVADSMCAHTVDVVGLPRAAVHRAVRPTKHPMALLLPGAELSLVDGSSSPNLDSDALLETTAPAAHVAHDFPMIVCAEAMC